VLMYEEYTALRYSKTHYFRLKILSKYLKPQQNLM
jgi:hypothetical protein